LINRILRDGSPLAIQAKQLVDSGLLRHYFVGFKDDVDEKSRYWQPRGDFHVTSKLDKAFPAESPLSKLGRCHNTTPTKLIATDFLTGVPASGLHKAFKL
jgi:hypothetical protein